MEWKKESNKNERKDKTGENGLLLVEKREQMLWKITLESGVEYVGKLSKNGQEKIL